MYAHRIIAALPAAELDTTVNTRTTVQLVVCRRVVKACLGELASQPRSAGPHTYLVARRPPAAAPCVWPPLVKCGLPCRAHEWAGGQELLVRPDPHGLLVVVDSGAAAATTFYRLGATALAPRNVLVRVIVLPARLRHCATSTAPHGVGRGAGATHSDKHASGHVRTRRPMLTARGTRVRRGALRAAAHRAAADAVQSSLRATVVNAGVS